MRAGLLALVMFGRLKLLARSARAAILINIGTQLVTLSAVAYLRMVAIDARDAANSASTRASDAYDEARSYVRCG